MLSPAIDFLVMLEPPLAAVHCSYHFSRQSDIYNDVEDLSGLLHTKLMFEYLFY